MLLLPLKRGGQERPKQKKSRSEISRTKLLILRGREKIRCPEKKFLSIFSKDVSTKMISTL